MDRLPHQLQTPKAGSPASTGHEFLYAFCLPALCSACLLGSSMDEQGNTIHFEDLSFAVDLDILLLGLHFQVVQFSPLLLKCQLWFAPALVAGSVIQFSQAETRQRQRQQLNRYLYLQTICNKCSVAWPIHSIVIGKETISAGFSTARC